MLLDIRKSTAAHHSLGVSVSKVECRLRFSGVRRRRPIKKPSPAKVLGRLVFGLQRSIVLDGRRLRKRAFQRRKQVRSASVWWTPLPKTPRRHEVQHNVSNTSFSTWRRKCYDFDKHQCLWNRSCLQNSSSGFLMVATCRYSAMSCFIHKEKFFQAAGFRGLRPQNIWWR